MQRAEAQKEEALHRKIGQISSLTAKVPGALQKKNAAQEETYFKRFENNIKKRQEIEKRVRDKEANQKLDLEIKKEEQFEKAQKKAQVMASL